MNTLWTTNPPFLSVARSRTGARGVWIFDPEGTHLGTVQPDEVPANVTFGNADGKTLYMTAHIGLYRVRLNTRGLVR